MARSGKHRTRLNGVVFLLAFGLIALCVLRSMSDKQQINRIPLSDSSVEAVSGLIDDISLDFTGGGDFFSSILEFFGISLAPSGGSSSAVVDGESVEVHFIDVGQGKAILLKAQGEHALIDVGDNGKGHTVADYLRQQKVERIDILIGTHPHSDHIGDMDKIIEEFEIGTVILPDIPPEAVPTTQTYTDLLLAIGKKGLKITVAKPGDKRSLGAASLEILGPVAAYTDLNDLSVVCRLEYGNTSFLFTGDIEAPAEADILDSRASIRSDVLDVAHHGSATSSTEAFLAKVRPKIAVISCGIDNSYGHPTRAAVERIEATGAMIYRTDLDGAVVIYSDGEELEVVTSQ